MWVATGAVLTGLALVAGALFSARSGSVPGHIVVMSIVVAITQTVLLLVAAWARRRHVLHVDALFAASKLILKADTVSEVADTAAGLAQQLLGASGVVVLVAERPGAAVLVDAARRPDGAAPGGVRVDLTTEQSVTAAVAWTGQPRFISDVRRSAEADQTYAERFHAASCLYVPIAGRTGTIGVMNVWWHHRRRGLDAVNERRIEIVTTLAGHVLDRLSETGRWRDDAHTDPLTGLGNRRQWSTELSRALARAARHHHPIVVGMLDLDHFKRYNDRYGHAGGDELLRELGHRWSELVRETDLVARLGGEEFAVALSDCSLYEAEAMSNRLRSAVPSSVTCSVGLAMWNGDESPEHVLARADQALYEAKRAGRDRVVGAP